MNQFWNNFWLFLDSYKLGHAAQYPQGTEIVYSNLTARDLKYANFFTKYNDNKIVVFGIQAVLKEMNQIWQDNFFKRDIEQIITEFNQITANYVQNTPFDVNLLRELHNYGKLPIRVKSLPEGSVVDIKVPILTIVNTDKKFYWLTNFLETWLSAQLWKPMTTATIARSYRQIIEYFANETGGSKDFIDFQGHDFSMRGMSGIYDAAMSGMGHLTSFMGSDTVVAAEYAKTMYPVNDTNYLFAASVPATEHSVMCVGSAEFGEFKLFKQLINEKYPTGIVSIVSDTWDFWQVISSFLPQLKDDIMNRDGKVVIRPDSGNPVHILTGYQYTELAETEATHSRMYAIWDKWDRKTTKKEDKCIVKVGNIFYELKEDDYQVIHPVIVKGAIESLWETFGGTINEKGYRTLDSHIGMIYGDSITTKRCVEILQRLMDKGFASDNVVFGIGSYTYNFISRDTLGFAMKATYCEINGKAYDIMKAPKTDSNKMKKSATGLLRVENGVLFEKQTKEQEQTGDLKLIFENGEFIKTVDFKTIRERIVQ